jgi:hypothetical protein
LRTVARSSRAPLDQDDRSRPGPSAWHLDNILTAIRVVAAGGAIIAPGVTRRLMA